MGLRISTNTAAMAASHQLSKSSRAIEQAMAQLSSGSRFAAQGEDPASHSISESLKGQIQGVKASKMNADNAIGFIQIAEGGLNEQNNLLIRMRELAIQASSDTVSEVERGFVDKEFTELSSEVDRIAQTTQFGSTKLLNGSGKQYQFQVGAFKGPENQIKFSLKSNTTAEALGITGTSVSEQSSALDAISDIDEALKTMASVRSDFGAIQSRLQSASNVLSEHDFNLEAARSRIEDTDVADAVSKISIGRIKQNFQVAVIAQANQMPEAALKLLS
jgi:flagellin